MQGHIKLSDAVKDAIRKATWHGDALDFGPPGSMERKLYDDVAKALKAAGFKWNRGRGAHVGTPEAVANLRAVIDGKDELVDLDKKFDFHPTVARVAEEMAHKLYSGRDTLGRVLEPSAGTGALIQALTGQRWANSIKELTLIDADKRRAPDMEALCKSKDVLKMCHDPETAVRRYSIGNFLDWAHSASPDEYFDSIIANPPFSKGADLKHIEAMMSVLAPGGRLVTLVSAGASATRLEEKVKLAADYTLKLYRDEPVVAGDRTDARSFIAVINRKAA